MDQIYANFVTRVATGRHLPVERVREIAKGRVWTGTQAKDLAGLQGDVPLRRMTPSEGTFEALQKALGVSATSAKTLAAAAWVFGDPRAEAIIDQAAQARLRDGGAMVLAPDRVH